jgi:hypothetical protein
MATRVLSPLATHCSYKLKKSSLRTVAVAEVEAERGGGVSRALAPSQTMLAQDGPAQESGVMAGMDPARRVPPSTPCKGEEERRGGGGPVSWLTLMTVWLHPPHWCGVWRRQVACLGGGASPPSEGREGAGPHTSGVSSLLTGVSSLLTGVSSLLTGVSSLLAGVSSLLTGVSSLLYLVRSLLERGHRCKQC